jgi:hypothetical protein
MADPSNPAKTKIDPVKYVGDKIVGALYASGLVDAFSSKEKKIRKKEKEAVRRGPLPGTVGKTLASAAWRPIFEEWLRDQGQERYVDFLSDVETYEQNATSQNLTLVVNQYIDPNVAPPQREITLDNSNMVTALVKTAANPPLAPAQDLFDRARADVIDNILENHFMAFKADVNSGLI